MRRHVPQEVGAERAKQQAQGLACPLEATHNEAMRGEEERPAWEVSKTEIGNFPREH